MKKFFLLYAICLLIAIPIIAQDTIHVPLPDYQTIQEAINAASNGDVILVAEGIYFENLQIESKSVVLASHYLIDGDRSHITNTTIDGSQPVNPDLASVIRVRWSIEPTVICGFTINGGKGTKSPVGERVGGGINAVRSSVTICDNRIIDNTLIENEGAGGGGISIYPFEVENLTIIVRNNLIDNNSKISYLKLTELKTFYCN